MDILAINLRELRKSRNPSYSQREIAEKLKVNRNTYAKYERGKIQPPISFIIEVSKFYNVDINKLLTMELERNECKS